MPIIDLHCDTILALAEDSSKGSLRQNRLAVDLEKLRAGEAKAQFFALFIDQAIAGNPLEYCLSLLDFFHQQLAANHDTIRWAGNWQDVLRHQADGYISAFLTIEEGAAIKGSLAHLRNFYHLGVRLMTLTWNYPNELGYPGCRPEWNGLGLTEAGKAVVAEMNRLGMLVDVSHLSDQGFYDVARLSAQPFVASHSNARVVTSHSRNLTDDMIRLLADKGGIMGLNFANQFLGDSSTSRIADMLRHAEHIVQTGGEDVLALGSDFDGISPEVEVHNVGEMGKLLQALLQAGFTERQVEKFAWRNAARVIQDVLG